MTETPLQPIYSLKELLRILHISKAYDAYPLLVTAVELAMEDEDRLLRVTKLLYPEIARRHGTSTVCVQKNLRKVIAVCWEHDGKNRIQAISGLCYEQKPTPEIFIGILADYMEKIQRGGKSR